MPMPRTDLLRGTLDLLILQSLLVERRHGVGVARRIEQLTQGRFHVGPGSLFPALHRLEEKGWLRAEWGESENNRRAKYYTLTSAGRRQLKAEMQNWARVSEAIRLAVQPQS
jgi:PadR family transcriptional regulator, regulatory protein PadR